MNQECLTLLPAAATNDEDNVIVLPTKPSKYGALLLTPDLEATESSSTTTTTALDCSEQEDHVVVTAYNHHDQDNKDPFETLPSFQNFAALTVDTHYRRLPHDWWVLVSDIQGSTAAIEAGRYRDVNTVGAMCIAVVRNALSGSNNTTITSANDCFPYVFGGDGATLVVRPTQKQAALQALLGLKRLVKQNYHLALRVGAVSVGQLEAAGTTVQVSKYEITTGLCLSFFRGGGLSMADSIVKHGQEEMLPENDDDDDNNLMLSQEDSSESEDDEYYELIEQGVTVEEAQAVPLAAVNDFSQQQQQVDVLPDPNLDGLSCRWHKIPNQRGCVLTLLVMANPDYSTRLQNNIYERVLKKLQHILTPDEFAPKNANDNDVLAEHNPVNVELATYKTASEMIQDEIRMHTSCLSVAWILRWVEILLCHVLFYWRILQTAIINVPAYRASMRTHADHRKFDDMLRMVVDCTPQQAAAMERMLQGMHTKGRQLFFGTLPSQHSLMTCLLQDASDGKHIHFIDGDGGGYALAAKQLKMQLGQYTMQKRGGQSSIGMSLSRRAAAGMSSSFRMVKRRGMTLRSLSEPALVVK